MCKIIKCEFNMDTCCVEIRFADNTMLSIDCEAVEDVYDIGVFERSELDWLIYNNPLEYAYHVLNGSVRTYLKGQPRTPLDGLVKFSVFAVPAGSVGGNVHQ